MKDLDLNPFIVNSIPKSGTHLLLQAVEGIPEVQAVHPPIMGGLKPIHPRIHELQQNHFMYGHVHYSSAIEQEFNKCGVKQLLLIRDPRDIILSLYYYMFKTLPNHPVRRYTEKYQLSKEEVINCLMLGIEDEEFFYPDLHALMRNYSTWLNNPHVLVLRYEDLNDPAKQAFEFRKLLRHLTNGNLPPYHKAIIHLMKTNIIPAESGTFRKGKSGEWRKEFTPRNKQIFFQHFKKLLKELGYR